MRSAFQVPSGCPTIVVDTDFLGSLPFCSVPSFPDPTFAPRITPQLPPDIAPPDPCLCLSFDVTGVERIASRAKISMHVSHPGADCCDGLQVVSLFMDVPCMPLSVAAHGHVSMAADIDTATALVSLKKSDPSRCGLSLNIDILVPCVPFGIDTTGQVSVKDISARAATAALSFSKRDNECVMVGTLDLDLPCVPFAVGAAAAVDGVVSVLTDPADEPGLSLNLQLAKSQCEVGVGGNFHLRLPAPYCLQGDSDVIGTNFKSLEVYEAE